MTNNDEIKVWQTQSFKGKVAAVLMMDGVSFSYTEEDGIVFTAPDFYVENLEYRLVTVFGCPKIPTIKKLNKRP